MSKKTAGWIIIGTAIVLGILHLLNVINAATTVILLFLAIIILGPKAKGFKKKETEPPEPEEK